MKILSIIILLLLIGCSDYDASLSSGEIEYVYPAYYSGNEINNELTWSLWEMESISGYLKGYPEYSGFYFYYINDLCTNVYKEANKDYYYVVSGKCRINASNGLNYLFGGGYFVGIKTFEVDEDHMTLQIDRGNNRFTWFLFNKISNIKVDVVYTQSIGD